MDTSFMPSAYNKNLTEWTIKEHFNEQVAMF